MTRKNKGLITLILIPLFLAGCATFVINSYKIEYGTGTAYTAAKAVAYNLNGTGTFTPEQWATVLKAGNITFDSYQLAVNALIDYKQAPSDGASAIVAAAIQGLADSWAQLVKLINDIKPGSITGTFQLKGVSSSGKPYTIELKKMSDGTLQIIIQVGAVIIEYLIKEFPAIIAAFNLSDVSLDQIKGLKTLITPFDQPPTVDSIKFLPRKK